jgi:hypothetical protein
MRGMKKPLAILLLPCAAPAVARDAGPPNGRAGS